MLAALNGAEMRHTPDAFEIEPVPAEPAETFPTEDPLVSPEATEPIPPEPTFE
jgi:hypothetical protein